MSKIAYTSLEELYSLFQAHSVITTDTRHCPEGSLFFALRGERFDGNAFAQQALQAGCAFAVIDDPAVGGDERLLHVPDVLTTLQQLAALHRRTLGTPIVQITGTNGKTTTKELTAAVLARKFDLLCTQGNFNNHIGVPKTLLQLRPHHQMAVIETGANHPGEIALLTDLVQPECGLITNVGMAHLEGFGSFEGVMRTKGELYDYLRHKPGGFIFLHADNEHLCRMAGSLPAVRYGLPGHDCYTEGEVLDCTPFLRLRFRTQGGAWHEVQTHLIGAYNVANVLAAAAVGAHFGVPDVDIAEALAAYEPTNNRSEWMRTQRNELIVDAYNANPTSMKAALDNFALIAHDHKMAILGEMRELGTASDEAHRAVAAQAASLHCEEVWLVGEAFRAHAAGARWFPSVAEVKAALEAEGAPTGRLILVKGSNGTRLFELP
ncbi:MAG: UDP-N-acetylmuramoyl-tripeptide--D-alanyl-D-alanine ligase, partial [Bacteroidales bacterium]|nr:UDP-N-acetylmuramoyl-tripeptide--D-alanyl-D-alanine ligase [Bacteroidales bacterium]